MIKQFAPSVLTNLDWFLQLEKSVTSLNLTRLRREKLVHFALEPCDKTNMIKIYLTDDRFLKNRRATIDNEMSLLIDIYLIILDSSKFD